MTYYAHSTERTDCSDWQPLRDHLLQVGELAASRGARFGASQLANLAGQLHDIGKYSPEFQRRLAGAGVRVDHATAGAQIVVERYGKLGYLLAYALAGHHAGLPNGRDDGTRNPLSTRLALEVPELDPAWKNEVPLDYSLTLPENFKSRQERPLFQTSVLIRMLFSCLVDADYHETAAFYGEAETTDSLPELETLRSALNSYLEGFETDGALNGERAHILQTVRSYATEAPGAFSLTVPTGGGKTLASLAFALDHAINNGLDRVIYVIPFTSIVEQTASVFRDALGSYGTKAVLEHHSGFIDQEDTETATIDKLRQARENWSAPIIVTTSVQFFESLFAARTSPCRKLHNIAGSVVILDEAQTLPLKLLRPCVAVLDELTRNYRSSLVLCTATQPALEERDDPQRSFAGGLRDVTELAPDPPRLQEVLRRTTPPRWLGTLDDDELASEVLKDGQILCIVNNRRHARALYESISDEPGAVLLTTALYPVHRRRVLAGVRERLAEGRPCRLIATSLIEAGVDVDFPRVLRAEAGLDSIIQAAGRCNREGRASADHSEVGVFATANEDWQPPRLLAQYAQAMRTIFRHYDNPTSLEAIEAYFHELYWQQGEQALDSPDILGRIERGGLDGLPFEAVADAFRLIDDGQYPVIIPHAEQGAKDAVQELEHAEYVGGIPRRLQGYIVQVPERAFQRLEAVGAVAPVCPDKFGNQFMQLINRDLYDDVAGLDWQDPTFRDTASNIW